MKGRPLGSGRRRSAAGAAAVALVLGASSGEAAAERITITNAAEGGRGSFAAAVRRAESDRDRDVIGFARELRGTIKIRDKVDFTHPVVIKGRGYGRKGGGAFGRVVLMGPRQGKSIDFIGLSEGGRRGASGGLAPDKGAIRGLYLERVRVRADESRVDVVRSHITGDATANGSGFYAYGKGSRIDRSTITGWEGGVSLVFGDVRIDRSTVSANRFEGGVQVGGYSNARITSSTISGNASEAGGGGVSVGYKSHVNVANSTISRNEAMGSDSFGGGVAGEVELNESTITGNRAARGGGVVGGYGPVTITNSIVAGNKSPAPAEGEDCYGEVFSRGGNLVQSPGSCSLQASDLSGVDPLLGPLADNGGPTLTHALRRGSPAIGLAIRRTATRRDQRGVRRDRDPDSGAYERRPRARS